MAESLVQVTEGSGKKLHTASRVVGANTVEDEYVIHGEPHLATYTITGTASIATANSHLLQLMAGASLAVYLRRLRLWTWSAPGATTLAQLLILRLTSAGTGGGAVSLSPLDTADAAAGATCQTLPTVKGTEGTAAIVLASAIMYTGAGGPTLLAEWDFDRLRSKMLRIPAGAANGICVKNATGIAGGVVGFEATIAEASY